MKTKHAENVSIQTPLQGGNHELSDDKQQPAIHSHFPMVISKTEFSPLANCSHAAKAEDTPQYPDQ